MSIPACVLHNCRPANQIVFLPSLHFPGASVSLPIEAKKYLKVLVEQSLLQFFVVVRVRESKQLFIKVSRASPPPISLLPSPPSHCYPPPPLISLLPPPISLLPSPTPPPGSQLPTGCSTAGGGLSTCGDGWESSEGQGEVSQCAPMFPLPCTIPHTRPESPSSARALTQVSPPTHSTCYHQ